MTKGSIQQEDIIIWNEYTQKIFANQTTCNGLTPDYIENSQNSTVETNHLITKNHGQNRKTDISPKRIYIDGRYAQEMTVSIISYQWNAN